MTRALIQAYINSLINQLEQRAYPQHWAYAGSDRIWDECNAACRISWHVQALITEINDKNIPGLHSTADALFDALETAQEIASVYESEDFYAGREVGKHLGQMKNKVRLVQYLDIDSRV